MTTVQKVAAELRERIGWSQKDMATALGVVQSEISKFENGDRIACVDEDSLLTRYRELLGIDLYVYAWCKHGDIDKLPSGMRWAASKLTEEFEEGVEVAVRRLAK